MDNKFFYSYTPKEGEPKAQPDPYIICHDGKFYIYSTDIDGVNVYSADSLDNWQYLGYALKQEGYKEFWAPCVIFLHGVFYMYYSSFPCGGDDVHKQQIKVATSKSPEGPFKYVKDLLEPFTIDPHVVQTESGLYMFYSLNDYSAERPGTYIALDKMTDPLTMEGKPATVVVPTLDEEIFCRNRFKAGEHWHTIEGAFYFYREGWHYLMYSGNSYLSPDYFIGYSAAKGEYGDLRDIPFKKMPDDLTYAPVLRQTDFVEGMGHNSVLVLEDGCYIVHHGRFLGERKKEHDTRTFFISPLSAKDGVLTVDLSLYTKNGSGNI